MRGLWLALLFSFFGLPGGTSLGNDDVSVRQALESMGSLPWYNAEQDQVEAVPVKPRIDDSSNRDSRWRPQPAKPSATATGTANTSNGNQQDSAYWRVWQWLLQNYSTIIYWVLLGTLVIALIILLVWVMSRLDPRSNELGRDTRQATSEAERIADLERMENLPVQVQASGRDLLAEADRLRAANRLADAIIYLFSHRLLVLDRAGAIRLSRGKTNHQYLREVRNRTGLYPLFSDTVQLFEQSYFGGYAIDTAKFDAVRDSEAQFLMALQQSREAA